MCVWPVVSKCCRLELEGQGTKGKGEVQTLQTRTRNGFWPPWEPYAPNRALCDGEEGWGERDKGQEGWGLRTNMTMCLLSHQALLPYHSCGGNVAGGKGASKVRAKLIFLWNVTRWSAVGRSDRCCPEAIPETGPKTEFSHSVSWSPGEANHCQVAMSSLPLWPRLATLCRTTVIPPSSSAL